jgi:hypothetical protein
MAIIGEARDILEDLLTQRGPSDPTFLRMVRWYRAVCDELDCRDTFEQMLFALLMAACGWDDGTSGEAPEDTRWA